MKEVSLYLLGVVTQSLRGGSPAQCPRFHHTIECTRGLLEICMHARYKSHYDAKLSYIEDAFCHCHTVQDAARNECLAGFYQP